MLILTERSPVAAPPTDVEELALTAAERTRSRHRFLTTTGQEVYLNLPRGTVLQHGDILRDPTVNAGLVRIVAKSEAVLTVTADRAIDLLRAAYHLGNRHVALEVTETYLRLEPDSVLATMLTQRGLTIRAEMAPFTPEAGAYDPGGSEPPPHQHSHAHPRPES